MHFFENQRNKAVSQVLTVGLKNFEPETLLVIDEKCPIRKNFAKITACQDVLNYKCSSCSCVMHIITCEKLNKV